MGASLVIRAPLLKGLSTIRSKPARILMVACLTAWSTAESAGTQTTGTVQGTVTRASDGQPLNQVGVEVQGLTLRTTTGARGTYRLQRVPVGEHVITFRWIPYRPHSVTVRVADSGVKVVDVALEAAAYQLSDIVVEAPSRVSQRITEAPGAVAVIDPAQLRAHSASGQYPLVLEGVPGIQAVETGMQRFNVNMRGFNSVLNNRVLLLVDGRELANYSLGFQQWNRLTVPMDEVATLEVVRGPGSALYGANAFNGVISVTTPTVRERVGSKVSLTGGELGTLRADARHAGLFRGDRFGYQLRLGHSRSDTWDRSRTLRDGSSCAREYAGATSDSVPANIRACTEAVPLAGQTISDTVSGAAAGDRDPIETTYGSVRLDYYADNGAVGTFEAGAAADANDVVVNAAGRAQPLGAFLPWARISWSHPRYNVAAWWSAASVTESVVSLASGATSRDEDEALHLEGQYHNRVGGGRVVLGTSYRRTLVKSGFLADPDEPRADRYYGVYGQFEYPIGRGLRAVVASRLDNSNRYETEWSPKAAVIITPARAHSIRFTINRAFLAPTVTANFLVLRGRPLDLTTLEDSLRASPATGGALDSVPPGQLFDQSAAVPTFALGNEHLEVSRILSYEAGYRGEIGRRLVVSVDAFYSRVQGFVACCFPAVNPNYPAWSAPPTVAPNGRAAVEEAVRTTAPGLTRLTSGQTASVVSFANGGKVDEAGVEVMLRVAVTPELQASASYAYLTFDIKERPPDVPPNVNTVNAPEHQGSVSMAYSGTHGLDLGASIRFSGSFDWFAGAWFGKVPARQTVTVTAGYRVNSLVRVHAVATNLLDQRRFHMFGGSVIGRRILAGVTATF